MRRIVLEAMRTGAIGFATSTLEQHNGENGVPMPSRLADEREMLALTGALGEAGRGVFMLTKGMTSTVPWLEKIAARRPAVMIAAMFVDTGDPTRVSRSSGEIEPPARAGASSGPGRRFRSAGVHPAPSYPSRLHGLATGIVPRRGALSRGSCDPSFRAASRTRSPSGVPNRFSDKNWDHLTIAEVQRPEPRACSTRPSAARPRPAPAPWDVFLDSARRRARRHVRCRLFNIDENEVQKLLRIPMTPSPCPTPASTCPSLDAPSACTSGATGWRGGSSRSSKRCAPSPARWPAPIASRTRRLVRALGRPRLFDPKRWARPQGRVTICRPARPASTRPRWPPRRWVNGVRTVDERGIIRDCGRPGPSSRLRRMTVTGMIMSSSPCRGTGGGGSRVLHPAPRIPEIPSPELASAVAPGSKRSDKAHPAWSRSSPGAEGASGPARRNLRGLVLRLARRESTSSTTSPCPAMTASSPPTRSATDSS